MGTRYRYLNELELLNSGESSGLLLLLANPVEKQLQHGTLGTLRDRPEVCVEALIWELIKSVSDPDT